MEVVVNVQWLGQDYLSLKWHVVCSGLATPVLEHPSAGSYFLASVPANFFSPHLSVPALFFLLPLFLAQLLFLFCLSILHAPSFSIPTSQMLPVVFAHSVVVSKSLHHTTLHSTHSTSLVTFVVLFPRVRRKCFFFCERLLLPLLSSALLLDSSSCCYWYYTTNIWSCPLAQWIHL